MYDDHYAYNPLPTGKIRFGKTEIRHIVIALGVLTLAFAIVLTGSLNGITGDLLTGFLIALLLSFIVVGTGFFLHEMAHKIMAQRFGAWAEFRIFPFGLMMALIFSFLGFIFAAPGAVYIQGIATKRENGLISIAGPATNLIIGIPFVIVWLLFPLGGLLGWFIYLMGYINVFLAFFNLLPIPPLDGSKVFRWNAPVYVLAMVASVTGLAVFWFL
jgi:Zn-dependent protease